MSEYNVDTRVVQMQFDNEQFEDGIRTTMNTLKKFKASLNNVASEDTSRAMKQSLGGIEEQLKSLQKRFSALGETITDFKKKFIGWAVDFGKTLSGVKGTKEGMEKYEALMNATRTMMNATGKSVEEIDSVFEDLYTYTDMTSYGFAELSDSMSQLIASGKIRDLRQAEQVVEGFANACAHAGISTKEAKEPLYV